MDGLAWRDVAPLFILWNWRITWEKEMNMYAKVFTSLFDGSMRGQSDVILVFINLLCHSDQDGTVDRHYRAICDETGLSKERVLAALKVLESPDDESRTPTNEGRRIVRIEDHRNWGWTITNYKHYRDLCTAKDRRDYQKDYMAERRRKGSVNSCKQSSKNVKTESTYTSTFIEFWEAYPKSVGKAAAFKSWKKLSPPLDKCLSTLEWQKKHSDWTKEGGKFIPHPATWLNRGSWDDEQTTTVKPRLVI